MIKSTVTRLLARLFKPATTGCQVCDLRRTALQEMHTKLVSATMAQSNQSRRLDVFRLDHPELWERYFTRKGDVARGVQA